MSGKECEVNHCRYPQGCVLEDQLKDLELEGAAVVPPARKFQELGCPKAETIIYSSRQPSREEMQGLMEQADFRPLWDNPRPAEEHAKRILASYGEPPEFYENLSPDQLLTEAKKRQELASQLPGAKSPPPKAPPKRALFPELGQFSHTPPLEEMLRYAHSRRGSFRRKINKPIRTKGHPRPTQTSAG